MHERLKEETDFDVLGDILETLRFRGSIFFRSELAAPWGMSLTQSGTPRFHIALTGDCFVGSDNPQNSAVRVQEGDVVMLPSGNSHWIADQPGRRLTPSASVGEACELGRPLFQQGQITNRLLCGLVHFDQNLKHPILESLPQFLHFHELKQNEPVWMTIKLIDAEIHRARNHGKHIVDRLTEVLFLQLLNHYVKHNQREAGFLAKSGDRRVHLALALIHREPNFEWSLSSLGKRTGMSRATLVRHFQEAVGAAPMTYITNWRITKAYSLIKYSSTTLEQVAETVGFGSARTLNKAFQRHYGCTPNELRRSQGD